MQHGNFSSPKNNGTVIRDLQRELNAKGLELVSEADEAGTGPASFIVEDPDGNQILIDQHV